MPSSLPCCLTAHTPHHTTTLRFLTPSPCLAPSSLVWWLPATPPLCLAALPAHMPHTTTFPYPHTPGVWEQVTYLGTCPCLHTHTLWPSLPVRFGAFALPHPHPFCLSLPAFAHLADTCPGPGSWEETDGGGGRRREEECTTQILPQAVPRLSLFLLTTCSHLLSPFPSLPRIRSGSESCPRCRQCRPLPGFPDGPSSPQFPSLLNPYPTCLAYLTR